MKTNGKRKKKAIEIKGRNKKIEQNGKKSKGRGEKKKK